MSEHVVEKYKKKIRLFLADPYFTTLKTLKLVPWIHHFDDNLRDKIDDMIDLVILSWSIFDVTEF